MYEILKNVISAGNYKLTEMQWKIKKLYILGDITQDECDELLSLAVLNVSFNSERPELLEIIKSLSDRISALESRLDNSGDIGGSDNEGEVETNEYPDWQPWDGISNKYQLDSIVKHNGKLWISIHPGQNVWEPGSVGSSTLWEEYIPAE